MLDISKIQAVSSNIEVDLWMRSSALGEKKCVDKGGFLNVLTEDVLLALVKKITS